jgi:hypothetical protein
MESAYLDILGRPHEIRVPLEEDRITLGKSPDNHAELYWDGTASRLHAVIERFPSGWSLRDMGSRNGTFLNGDRIAGERALRPGDEIRVGQTLMVFKLAGGRQPVTPTAAAEGPPEMTRREREVLVALCRPILTRSVMAEPPSIQDVAAELVISESTAKKHIGRLFDKFELHDPQDRRRGHLVAEAIRRGAVTGADL